MKINILLMMIIVLSPLNISAFTDSRFYINDIYYRYKLDLNIKSNRGWLRVLNHHKLQQYTERKLTQEELYNLRKQLKRYLELYNTDNTIGRRR